MVWHIDYDALGLPSPSGLAPGTPIFQDCWLPDNLRFMRMNSLWALSNMHDALNEGNTSMEMAGTLYMLQGYKNKPEDFDLEPGKNMLRTWQGVCDSSMDQMLLTKQDMEKYVLPYKGTYNEAEQHGLRFMMNHHFYSEWDVTPNVLL